MAADPFFVFQCTTCYLKLFLTNGGIFIPWGQKSLSITFFFPFHFGFLFPWIFMMDTGIFLLNIIFIRYRVCCQNTRVINIVRVYITTLPEAVRSHQRFPTLPVPWVLPTTVRAAPGAPQHPPPMCIQRMSARVGCFPKYHVPQIQHLQTVPPSAARFCCSSCHGITDLMHRGFVLFWKHTRVVPLVRMMKSLLLSWGKLLLICVCNRRKKPFSQQ